MNTKQDLLNSFKKSYKLEEGNRKHKQSLYNLNKHSTTSSKTGDVEELIDILINCDFGESLPEYNDFSKLVDLRIYVYGIERFYSNFFNYVMKNKIACKTSMSIDSFFKYLRRNGFPEWNISPTNIVHGNYLFLNVNNGAILGRGSDTFGIITSADIKDRQSFYLHPRREDDIEKRDNLLYEFFTASFQRFNSSHMGSSIKQLYKDVFDIDF